MTISPSGSPNSCSSDASACRAMAISVSAAPFCSSIGAVSYQRNGARAHAAALGADHRVEPQPHLVGALGRDQQHAALPLDGMAQERLAGPQRGRQIEHDEGLAGAPLAGQQPVPAGRDQVLDQPALERPRIRIAVCIQRRQLRLLFRRLLDRRARPRAPALTAPPRARDRLGHLGCTPGSGCSGALASQPSTQPGRQRQLGSRIFAGAPGDLSAQPALAQVAVADAVRELLQVLQDLLNTPATAEVMADDRVKYVAAVGTLRGSRAHDLLDLIDAVAAAAAVEAYGR